MKKNIITFLLITVLVLSASTVCFADDLTGADDWEVEFNSSEEIVSSFSTDEIADAFAGIQPGDNITLTVTVKNTSGKTVDWYMLNEIVKALEDNQESAAGGGYTYLLTYTGADGEVNEIYSSSTIGGEIAEDEGDEAPEGLHEVDSALKEYLYLERMETGKSGEVTLYVALDGETIGNAYQKANANIRMRFAVEVVPTKTIITGDSAKPLNLLYIAMGILGLILLILGLDGYFQGKKNRSNASKIAAVFLIAALLFAATPAPVFADTTYTVRVYGGNPSVGELTVGENGVYEVEVAYGEVFTFDVEENVQVNDTKYYAKGIRESGKDNATYQPEGYTITEDTDFVVAYGMKSTMVKYTVNYVDANGDPLMDSRTYYGNIGDNPVVAFLYQEGYQPQEYELTQTLVEDESQNVFTFEYTEIEPEVIVIVLPGAEGGYILQEDLQVQSNPLQAWALAASGTGLFGLLLPSLVIARKRNDDETSEQ